MLERPRSAMRGSSTLLAAACLLGSWPAGHASPVNPSAASVQELPALPAQDSPGWRSLFDGRTLNGWQVLNGTATYAVEDGAIVGTTASGSPNSFLCSKEYFGDFLLEFDVKLFDGELNSGCQIRSQSYPTYQDRRVHGYQVEISTNGEAGFVYDEARRGWLSKDRSNPEARAAFHDGEWNHYRVIALGPRIWTSLNDVPVADVTDSLTATGFLGLQVHAVSGDPHWRVAWKNLKIHELGDGGGFSELFDGKSLEGWKVAENPGSCKVLNGEAGEGEIVVGGPRAHVYYDGPIYSHSFQNFEFVAEVKTEPGANSGIYFHTAFQESGWPAKGYEVQVNNTQSDWRRTGGLYAIDDVREAPAKDGEWFEMRIRVEGSRVQVWVDGKRTVDYTQPADVERPADMAGRLLDRGTFALQCHDPGSIVHYRSLRVKVLPETLPGTAAEGTER